MKQKSLQILPDNYTKRTTINLESNHRQKIILQIIHLLVLSLVFIYGLLVVPLTDYINKFASISGIILIIMQIIILLCIAIVYVSLHEMTHALMMYLWGATKIEFSITSHYACVGSNKDFFRKTPYIYITLAPFVIWTPVLFIVSMIVSSEWFWVFWTIEAMNIAGSIGDLYIFWKVTHMSRATLIKDNGFEIIIYDKENVTFIQESCIQLQKKQGGT